MILLVIGFMILPAAGIIHADIKQNKLLQDETAVVIQSTCQNQKCAYKVKTGEGTKFWKGFAGKKQQGEPITCRYIVKNGKRKNLHVW